MLSRILNELEQHAPFTLFGAFIGIVLMPFLYRIPQEVAYNVFYILHPLHVFLSALVTASLYDHYKCGRFGVKCNVWTLLVVGYIGAVGIATLSDSVVPFLGEKLLSLPHQHIHLGFIEEWWLVNPMAILGIAVAYLKPSTKFPHFGHVLLSTGASLFHVIMALGGVINFWLSIAIFVFLFIAVWVPCCFSDIVYPLLFVKD